MKKMNRTAMALCAMALVLGMGSCRKDNTTEIGGKMTIGAVIDLPGGMGDKTEVDPSTGLVKWTDDDKIMLYSGTNGEEFTWESMVEGEVTKAYFTGDNPGDLPYYGSYKATGCNGPGTFTFNIPADQSSFNVGGTFENGPMIAYAENKENIVFKNAASWMRIGLKGLAQISKVELSDNTSGAILNGTLTASIDESGKVTAEMTSGESNTLFVTFAQPLQLMYEELTYITFLVPANSFKAGATVNVYDFKGNKLETINGTSMGTEGVPMNKIYNIKTSKIIKPISPEGSTGGIFNVGTAANPKMVYIAKGNLACDKNTMTWSFKNDQLDVCGEESLFTWSNNTFNDYGTNLNRPNYFASQDMFQDWGENPITNGGNQPNLWYTGSVTEWENLLENHGRAICFIGVDRVYGQILLPLAFPKELDIETGAEITSEQWAAMAEAGAVFLTNGCESYWDTETDHYVVATGMGCYYTSTCCSDPSLPFPYSYGFPDPNWGSLVFSQNIFWASYGFYVRLFQEVK